MAKIRPDVLRKPPPALGKPASEDAPADVKEMLGNLMSAIAIDEYLDLRDPMLH